MTVLADFYTKFNTGAMHPCLISDVQNWGFPWSTGDYSVWVPARPYTKYAYIESAISIKTDGTYYYDAAYWSSRVGYLDISTAYLQHVLDLGFIPIMQLWVTNFDTPDAYGNPALTEAMLRAYFRNLSAWLGNRQIIWMPCYEFNFNPDWSTWGTRGNTVPATTWKLNGASYNKVMGWARNIIDSENLGNILLGVHMNAPYWSGSDSSIQPPIGQFINDYLEGMQKADILGSSSYESATVAIKMGCWAQVKRIWDIIGTGKPWIFFEYGILPWGNLYPIEVVNASYQLLDTYPFVKGVIWYIPPESIATSGATTTITAIRDNAQTHNQGGSIIVSPQSPNTFTFPTIYQQGTTVQLTLH